MTGLYCGGFQSVPLSLLESTVQGVRAIGGVGWGLDKNEGLGSAPPAFTPAPTGTPLLLPILNTLILPQTAWEGGGLKTATLLSEHSPFPSAP